MRTLTGLFDDYDNARDAVGELEAMGVPQSDISIVANNSNDWYDNDTSNASEDAAGGAGLGALVGGAGGLLTGLGIMAIPGVGPVVAAGWLAATAAGAVAGAAVGGAAGGIVGALADSGVPENDAHVYAEGVRRGGTLVTAKVADALVTEAEQVLSQSNSVNLAERRRAYEAGGWTGFDPEAGEYSADPVDLDEPDLWLATDGTARWGEMNGAHRVEFDGCYDVDLRCSPLTNSLPIRRLPLEVGDSAELPVVGIDVETLEAMSVIHRYMRLGPHRWAFAHNCFLHH